MRLILTLTFRINQDQMQICQLQVHVTSYLLKIAMFALFATVCEIIVYKLPNALDSIHWPWKWRSRALTILIKIGRRTYFVKMHMSSKITLIGSAFVLLRIITDKHPSRTSIYDASSGAGTTEQRPCPCSAWAARADKYLLLSSDAYKMISFLFQHYVGQNSSDFNNFWYWEQMSTHMFACLSLERSKQGTSI